MDCITTERTRLYCGDCFRVLEEIPGRDVDGVIIDPPYSSGGTFSTMRKGDTYKKYCRSGSDFGKDKSFTGDNMDMRSFTRFLREVLFLTRGCPRQCGFCIVGKKEGTISRQVADLSEFWNGQREIKLLDPNILACKDRERLLQELAASGAWVDFTQGLDIRLIEGAEDLVAAVKIKRIHFAWDNPEQNLRPQFEKFRKKCDLNYSKLGVYVLVNFNSTHEQDLERVYFLRGLGYDPYIMIYEKETAPRETRLLQRWVNNRIIFRSCPRFEDYDPRRG